MDNGRLVQKGLEMPFSGSGSVLRKMVLLTALKRIGLSFEGLVEVDCASTVQKYSAVARLAIGIYAKRFLVFILSGRGSEPFRVCVEGYFNFRLIVNTYQVVWDQDKKKGPE